MEIVFCYELYPQIKCKLCKEQSVISDENKLTINGEIGKHGFASDNEFLT